MGLSLIGTILSILNIFLMLLTVGLFILVESAEPFKNKVVDSFLIYSVSLMTVAACIILWINIIITIGFVSVKENILMAWLVGIVYTLLSIWFALAALVFFLENKFPYYSKDWNEIRKNETALHIIESERHCCGYDGPYYYERITPPPSCYPQGAEGDPSLIYQRGCIDFVSERIVDFFHFLIGLLGACSILTLISAGMAFYLYNSLRQLSTPTSQTCSQYPYSVACLYRY